MKTWTLQALVFTLILTLLACSSKKEEAINFGQYSDGVYANSYFNIQVSLPEAWYVMDDESRIAMMRKGAEIVSGDNKNLKALLDASDMQSMNLLTAVMTLLASYPLSSHTASIGMSFIPPSSSLI